MTALGLSRLLRGDLVDELVRRGYLRSPGWRAAFLGVAREDFVDRFTVPAQDGAGREYDLNDDAERAAALRAVYSDAALLTRFDAGGTACSSSSAPSLMAFMLEALRVEAGTTVLEIGTGTGYNAALLAHRLGQHRVSSVDLDCALVSQAGARLAAAGYRPKLAATDGALGWPEHAPYDRMLATCAVDRIPVAWLRQVPAGGAIVANVGFALVRLVVRPDGGAAGPVLTEPAAFMPMRRDAGQVALTGRDLMAATSGPGATRTAPLPGMILDRTARIMGSLAVPGLHWAGIPADRYTHVYVDQDTGSWCRAREHRDGRTVSVTESGPRPLWQEICAALDAWHDAGRPAPQRHQLVVHPDGEQQLVVGSPEQPQWVASHAL